MSHTLFIGTVSNSTKFTPEVGYLTYVRNEASGARRVISWISRRRYGASALPSPPSSPPSREGGGVLRWVLLHGILTTMSNSGVSWVRTFSLCHFQAP